MLIAGTFIDRKERYGQPAAADKFTWKREPVSRQGKLAQARSRIYVILVTYVHAPSIGLLAAIRSEYIRPEQWRAWADVEIVKMPKPHMWLIDLSIAKDYHEAWIATADSVTENSELQLRDLDEIALGLIVLQYFEGRIGFREFLLRAGDHTDPSSCSTDCEFFYLHLNRYEMTSDKSRYEDEAKSEIQLYLSDAIRLAEVAKQEIRPITEQIHGDER